MIMGNMKNATKKLSKKRLKIGLLVDDSLDEAGGVQQYVLTLGEWLESMGHSVHYICAATTRTDLKNMHSMTKTLRVPFNGNRLGTPLPVRRKRVAELLAKHKFDIVHVQTPHSPLFAARFINALPDKTKVISTLHVLPLGLVADLGTKHAKRLVRSSLDRIDRFIANTEATGDYYQDAWGVESTVVPNPVKTSKFMTRSSMGWDKSKKQVVFLGRLVDRKGVLQFVEAVTMLPRTIRGTTQFHIGGNGPLADDVSRIIIERKLQDCVFQHGFIDEETKSTFLASADIAVFPSIGGESFGVSIIEPMVNSKTIVLAGHNEGYDGVMGERPDLMFDARSPKAISSRISKWLKASDTDLKSTKKWLKNHVKQYDIDTSVGTRIVDVYRS